MIDRSVVGRIWHHGLRNQILGFLLALIAALSTGGCGRTSLPPPDRFSKKPSSVIGHSTAPGPRINVEVMGAVREPGSKAIPRGTPLEELLNLSHCHSGSYLNRIRVRRNLDDKTQWLMVTRRAESRGKRVQTPFQLQDGDLVYVQLNMFGPDDGMAPRVVEGPFYLEPSLGKDSDES